MAAVVLDAMITPSVFGTPPKHWHPIFQYAGWSSVGLSHRLKSEEAATEGGFDDFEKVEFITKCNWIFLKVPLSPHPTRPQ